MKCPHCTVEVHPAFSGTGITNANGHLLYAQNSGGLLASWVVNAMICPACKKGVLFLKETPNDNPAGISVRLIQPKSTVRPPASPEVPADLAEDFNEACAVIEDSPKASAALSRRCLQGVLRGNGYTQHDLAPAITAILAAKVLPTPLAVSLDAIRNIGNFAAHPMKDTNSGEILPVEPHEAEWNLDVLEGLFDYFYVAPAREQAKIAVLNAKLASAGKPPIK